MNKIYYEKVGKRYKPVAEFDSDWLDSFTKGSHLITCRPGATSRRFNIDPNYAAMIAAGIVAEDAICRAMVNVSELRLPRELRKVPLTTEQQQAWNNLVETMGDDATRLEWASYREVAEEGVKAMQEEAMKLMTVPAVKKAYEQFLLVCELTKDEQANS